MFSGGGVQKHSIYPISGLELESECTVATVDWRSRQTRCHQLAITWRVIAQANKWPFPVSKCHSERNHTKSYIYRDRTEKLPLIHIFIIQLPLCIIILIYLIHLYKSDYNFSFWAASLSSSLPFLRFSHQINRFLYPQNLLLFFVPKCTNSFIFSSCMI